MLLLKTVASPSRRLFARVTSVEPLCTVTCQKLFLKGTELSEINQKRLIHFTHVNRDMESSVKVLGAGFAAAGIMGPGIGMGILFGNLLSAVSRNPSISNKLFQYGVMGAALCESLAFFSLMVAFVAMT